MSAPTLHQRSWLVATLCFAAPVAAAGQEAATSHAIRGSVRSANTDALLPFSVVELLPGHPRRLTDDSARFRFTGLAPGRYRLVVRQIGYTPVDSAITVEDASIQIDVKLWRIGITLPAVTVTGTTECRTPGAPHREVTPDLAAVFDQVVENAHRLALLADSFPHTMRLERRFAELKGDEQRPTSIDTLEVESTERWPYRPGNIVGLGAGARRGERVVRLPTLIDFADTAFVTHHCFWLAGRDTLEGERFVRMDFQPPLSLNATDVAGAAYLDSATYLIRYTVVRLTRPQRALPGLKSLVATSRFREVVPWILVADRIRAVREPRRLWEPDMVEEQLLIGVDFTRPLVGRP